MKSPIVQISGLPGGKYMQLLTVIREFTGTTLAQAKQCCDQLKAGQTVDLHPAEPWLAMRLGETLLQHGLVARADLCPSDGSPAHPITPPPPPPVLLCPSCNAILKDRSGCPACNWLRFPGDRARWQSRGPCPRCGFTYRWDGARCSHCGLGTTEQSPLIQTRRDLPSPPETPPSPAPNSLQ
jgi:hypothetical protein